jgi:hypothetical protein
MRYKMPSFGAGVVVAQDVDFDNTSPRLAQ